MSYMASPATPARASGTTVIACVALTLSGIAVGILIGRTLGPTTPVAHAEDGIAPQVDFGPMLDELRKIEDLLARTTTSNGSPPSPAVETRAPASATNTEFDLDAEIEQLKREVAGSKRPPGVKTVVDYSWKGPGFTSLDELFQRLEQDRQPGGDWISAAVAEMNKAHLGWTRDDLFERYGPPTSMGAGEHGLSISYAREKKPGILESMLFVCADGLVTGVWPSVP